MLCLCRVVGDDQRRKGASGVGADGLLQAGTGRGAIPVPAASLPRRFCRWVRRPWPWIRIPLRSAGRPGRTAGSDHAGDARTLRRMRGKPLHTAGRTRWPGSCHAPSARRPCDKGLRNHGRARCSDASLPYCLLQDRRWRSVHRRRRRRCRPGCSSGNCRCSCGSPSTLLVRGRPGGRLPVPLDRPKVPRIAACIRGEGGASRVFAHACVGAPRRSWPGAVVARAARRWR